MISENYTVTFHAASGKDYQAKASLGCVRGGNDLVTLFNQATLALQQDIRAGKVAKDENYEAVTFKSQYGSEEKYTMAEMIEMRQQNGPR